MRKNEKHDISREYCNASNCAIKISSCEEYLKILAWLNLVNNMISIKLIKVV